MQEAMLLIIQQIYIPLHARFGRISHNESSVHGHESLKTYNHIWLCKYCNTIKSRRHATLAV